MRKNYKVSDYQVTYQYLFLIQFLEDDLSQLIKRLDFRSKVTLWFKERLTFSLNNHDYFANKIENGTLGEKISILKIFVGKDYPLIKKLETINRDRKIFAHKEIYEREFPAQVFLKSKGEKKLKIDKSVYAKKKKKQIQILIEAIDFIQKEILNAKK